MKKILLCSISLLCFTVISQAQGVFHLTKKGGSETGFDHVKQHTDAKGNTEMTCTGAGNSKCEFIAPPPTHTAMPADFNKIIGFVDSEMKKGKHSGKAVVEGLSIQWNGSDLYNYTLTAGNPKSVQVKQ